MTAYWHWYWGACGLPDTISNWDDYAHFLRMEIPDIDALYVKAFTYLNGAPVWVSQDTGNPLDPSAGNWTNIATSLEAQGIELFPWIVPCDVPPAAAIDMANMIVNQLPDTYLILDIEPYAGMWSDENAALASQVSASLREHFTLWACVDARSVEKLNAISISDWQVEKVMPMCYWHEFGTAWQATIDTALANCNSYELDVPIVPILGNYPVKGVPVSPSDLAAAEAYCAQSGYSVFRIGSWMW